MHVRLIHNWSREEYVSNLIWGNLPILWIIRNISLRTSKNLTWKNIAMLSQFQLQLEFKVKMSRRWLEGTRVFLHFTWTIISLNFLRWKIDNSLSSVILFRKEPKKKKTIFFTRLEHAGTTGLDKGGAAPTALWIGMHWPVIVALGDRPDLTWHAFQSCLELPHTALRIKIEKRNNKSVLWAASNPLKQLHVSYTEKPKGCLDPK